MMRPNVDSPTGTVMPLPVSTTSWPRTRPSVESIAMARTVFSPRCWATSNTRRIFSPVRGSVLVVSRAFRIAGRLPSNSTSTTAPMICDRRPLLVMFAGAFMVMFPLNGGGAGDDLDQFGRDLGLAGTVHLDGQCIDQI